MIWVRCLFILFLLWAFGTYRVHAQPCAGVCWDLTGSTMYSRHPTIPCKAVFVATYNIDVSCITNFVVTPAQQALLNSNGCSVVDNTGKILIIKCSMDVSQATNSFTLTDAFSVVSGTDTCLYSVEEIFEKTLPAATITADSCGSDKNTGKISVTAMNGSTIVWNPSGYGTCYPSPAQCWIYRNLPGGEYKITVTDTFGCITKDTLTVSDLSPNAEAVPDSIFHPVCSGDTTGYIRVRINHNGSTPQVYNYRWTDQRGNTLGTDTVLANIGAGLYFFNLSIPGSPCILSKGFYVHAPPAIEVLGNITEPRCAADNTGQILLAVTPSGNYTYLWNTGVVTANLTGLVSGTYTVTVTNQDSCRAVAIFDVSSPDAISFGTLTADSVRCNGDSTGRIFVDPNGGMPFRVETGRLFSQIRYEEVGYNFKLYKSNVLVDSVNKQREWLADSLAVGTYVLEVSDSVGCSVRDTIVIDEPDSLNATLVLEEEVDCADPCSGKLKGTGSGGTPPYLFYNVVQKDLNDVLRQSVKVQYLGAFVEVNRLSGYGPGKFQMEIVDSNGCTVLSNEIEIPDSGREYHPADLNPCVACQTCSE